MREVDKIAIMSCVEVALMRRGNANYNLVVAKLHASYEMSVIDCYDNPEPLIAVLKGVYRQDYDSVVDAIELELESVEGLEKEVAEFLKTMRS